MVDSSIDCGDFEWKASETDSRLCKSILPSAHESDIHQESTQKTGMVESQADNTNDCEKSQKSKHVMCTPPSIHMYLGQGIANGSYSEPQLSCFDREEDGNQVQQQHKRRKPNGSESDIDWLLRSPSASR
jgi:hypothetical protein